MHQLKSTISGVIINLDFASPGRVISPAHRDGLPRRPGIIAEAGRRFLLGRYAGP